MCFNKCIEAKKVNFVSSQVKTFLFLTFPLPDQPQNMASGFNFPPPTGAPNVNSSTPLRPYYGSPLDSPLQQYYQHTSQLEEELSHHSELNSQEAARELLSYGMIKYLTLAIATPFENAQTLLQVQYLPNDDGASSSGNDDSRAAEASFDQIDSASTSFQQLLAGFCAFSHQVMYFFNHIGETRRRIQTCSGRSRGRRVFQQRIRFGRLLLQQPSTWCFCRGFSSFPVQRQSPRP